MIVHELIISADGRSYHDYVVLPESVNLHALLTDYFQSRPRTIANFFAFTDALVLEHSAIHCDHMETYSFGRAAEDA